MVTVGATSWPQPERPSRPTSNNKAAYFLYLFTFTSRGHILLLAPIRNYRERKQTGLLCPILYHGLSILFLKKAFSGFLILYNREAKQKINKISGVLNIF
jgi:hypothetical protein